MSVASKLLPATFAAMLIVSLADGASASPKRLPLPPYPVQITEEPYDNGPHSIDSKGPAVVDSYAPNPFGLYQVHGNVFEWTEDCFNKRYNEDTPADGSPWLEGDCNKRVLRRHLGLDGEHGARRLPPERDHRRLP